MEDTKKTPAELVADLMLDPGFVLVPQDRYEELIRAETERDVLEATIKGENSYNVERVLDAIQQARSALYRMKMLVLRTRLQKPVWGKGNGFHRHRCLANYR